MSKAREWEQNSNPVVREAWQRVWEYVRASRIGGATTEWAYSDDAFLLATEFATEILGEEAAEEFTAEFEDLTQECINEIASLL